VDQVEILGVRVDSLTSEQALAVMSHFIASGQPHQVVTINPEFVVVAHRDEGFRQALLSASLCLADGIGLIWASHILGKPLPERVAGVDTVQRLAEQAAAKGWRLYLLGAAPGVAEKVAAVLQTRHPGLQIAGTYAGSPAEEEAAGLIERIRQARPDVLFVAYGAPAQDVWIHRHLAELNVPLCMGVGGAFDFIAGVAKRAPRWIQRLGLEWLHRLIHQPWRWRRMLALPTFAWWVFKARIQGSVMKQQDCRS